MYILFLKLLIITDWILIILILFSTIEDIFCPINGQTEKNERTDRNTYRHAYMLSFTYTDVYVF